MDFLPVEFECAICMDTPKVDPIVTRCGHLYCWFCLRKWLQQQSASEGRCPACRSAQVLPFIWVAQEVKYRDEADSNNEVDEAPDFSCAICRVPRAVEPVILSECGHLSCWTCFEHHFREASLQRGAIKCPVPCCLTESSSAISLYVGTPSPPSKLPAIAGKEEDRDSAAIRPRHSVFLGSRTLTPSQGYAGGFIAAIGDSIVSTVRVRDCILRHYTRRAHRQQ
ncbi:hypothetical protein KP509_19G012100 [Ceratopteris richardii]|uniref:RING-type E3 ubiquitin transferase n=1 Tax=Ceratopteris richardii TaxID=49495 RepID=A0A8T2SLH0_CERRI|nr:hypothetical protein KP509_19G012100 [Ceratopteris richardii]